MGYVVFDRLISKHNDAFAPGDYRAMVGTNLIASLNPIETRRSEPCTRVVFLDGIQWDVLGTVEENLDKIAEANDKAMQAKHSYHKDKGKINELLIVFLEFMEFNEEIAEYTDDEKDQLIIAFHRERECFKDDIND